MGRQRLKGVACVLIVTTETGVVVGGFIGMACVVLGMSSLNLDDTEVHMFEHTAGGYGAVITGGSPAEREEALRTHIDGPFTVVNCNGITSSEEFVREALRDALGDDVAEDVHLPSAMDLSRGLAEAGTNLLILEFDSMEYDVQKPVAQLMKGVSERRDWDGSIGYACEEGDAVVKAEGDLRMRVKTWSLDD